MTAPDPDPGALLGQLIRSITDHATACHLDGSLVDEIGDVVDATSLEAKAAEQSLIEALRSVTMRSAGSRLRRPSSRIHRGHRLSLDPRWCSGSVSTLVREVVAGRAGEIAFYDGRTLPFDDAISDAIYSLSVFHHLRRVDEVLSDVARVLHPGGMGIGQISTMEQTRDYGTFDFTPFGMKVAAAGADLRLERIYPKHDVFPLLTRRLMITLGASDDNQSSAYLNPDGFAHRAMIDACTRLNRSKRDINSLRSKFSTQYVFQLRKDR